MMNEAAAYNEEKVDITLPRFGLLEERSHQKSSLKKVEKKLKQPVLPYTNLQTFVRSE